MSRPAGVALRAVLVVVIVVLLLIQVIVLPVQAAESASRFPEAAFLEVPVLAAAIITIACVQVAALCVMALLTLVGQGRIFDPGAYRYVDVFIAVTALASVVTAATGVCISASVGSPAWISGGMIAVVGAGVALLMVVMRALLHQATEQRAELAEVV